MKMNKIMVTPTLFVSILFSISSPSWILMWMSLEINSMMFIFLVLTKINITTTEMSMKYFLIQSLGSLLFLLSLSSNFIYFCENSTFKALLPPMALMLKGGIAPFHMWMTDTLKMIELKNLFLFLTFQKIAPIMIIYSSWHKMIIIISIINIIMGSLSGIIQSSLIKMLICSSVSNTGWMFLSLMNSYLIFYFQFSVYTMLMSNILMVLRKNKIKWTIQFNMNSAKKNVNMYMNMLSLSGMPPLLGFTPKWLIIKNSYTNNASMMFIFILFSSFNLFFYLKSVMTSLFMSSSTKKWKKQIYSSTPTMFLTNFLGIPLFILFN